MDRSPELLHKAHGAGKEGGGDFWAHLAPQHASSPPFLKQLSRFAFLRMEERNTNKGHTGLIKLIPIHVSASCLRHH